MLLRLFVFVIQSEERVVGYWTEFISRCTVEGEGGHLSEEISEPNPSERKSGVEEIHNDSCEVDVGYYKKVELSEQLQLVHISCCFAVNLRSFLQMLDRPNDGHQDSTTADDVYKSENVLPSEPSLSSRSGFFDDNHRDVIQYLKRNNNQEDSLVFV